MDRKAVLTNIKNYGGWDFKTYPLVKDEADVIIEALETPEIVRCKDCQYNKIGSCHLSESYNEELYDPEWFCADGCREDGE